MNRDVPKIDILINNAGTILRKPAAEHPDEYWDKIIETNLSAQFVLTREIGKQMVARKSGKVIFTASLLSFQGGITVPGYAAAKGGIASLVKAFANEWASQGVNVNAIAPGYISTDNTEALRNDPTRSTQILAHPRGPMGRSRGLQRASGFSGFGRIRLRARDDSVGGRRVDGAVSERIRIWKTKVRG